jgi:hypothetical protein
MHYRNGREAKNGDPVIQLAMDGSRPIAVGTLQNAVAGNDYCNGQILINGGNQHTCGPAIIVGACLCDCLHADDLAALLEEQGLHKRPPGK